MAARTSRPGIEDVTTMCLTFTNQRSAIIHSSWLDPRKVREMTIVGSKRMIVYDDVAPLEKIRVFDMRVERPPHYDTFGEFQYAYHYGDMHAPYIKQEEPLKTECQHFLDCIQARHAALELRHARPRTRDHFGGLVRIVAAGRRGGATFHYIQCCCAQSIICQRITAPQGRKVADQRFRLQTACGQCQWPCPRQNCALTCVVTINRTDAAGRTIAGSLSFNPGREVSKSGYTPWQTTGPAHSVQAKAGCRAMLSATRPNKTKTCMKHKTMRALMSATLMSLLVILNAPAQTINTGLPPIAPRPRANTTRTD